MRIERKFNTTHVIQYYLADPILVMLDDRRAYTREEWEAEDLADYELSDDGEWLFQGRPFAGTVDEVAVAIAWDECGDDSGYVARLRVNGDWYRLEENVLQAAIAEAAEQYNVHPDSIEVLSQGPIGDDTVIDEIVAKPITIHVQPDELGSDAAKSDMARYVELIEEEAEARGYNCTVIVEDSVGLRADAWAQPSKELAEAEKAITDTAFSRL